MKDENDPTKDENDPTYFVHIHLLWCVSFGAHHFTIMLSDRRSLGDRATAVENPLNQHPASGVLF